MAVITPLSHEDIENFCARYPLGPVVAVQPSTGGIENTTYFVTTGPSASARNTEQTAENEEWVLTLVEHANSTQVDFTCQLLCHLAQSKLPAPAPLSAIDGHTWHQLAGKPAWLIPRITGRHPSAIDDTHCTAIGDFLGAMHCAGEHFAPRHQNTRGIVWLRQTNADLALPPAQQQLLDRQLTRWDELCNSPLPTGPIHGDLFHDNALFKNGRLVAVIDFLFCCSDWLLLDVAIAVNDWCDDGRGRIDESLCHALLAAYSARRPFTLAEYNHWQDMLALAATRFWVSRLQPSQGQSQYLDGDPSGDGPPAGKDPEQYRCILEHHLQGVTPLPLAL